MNMLELKPWQHLTLSLTVLALLVVGIYLVLVRPAIQSRYVFSDRVEEMQFQYERYTRMSLQTEDLRQEVNQLEQTKSPTQGFIEEKADSLAAADLQNHVKTLVNNAGGNLVSTQVIQQGNQEDIFPSVSIKVHLRGTIETLQKLLHNLSSTQPVLLTDNVLVQKRHSSNRRRAQRGADQLEIRFDVTGFIYKAEQS